MSGDRLAAARAAHRRGEELLASGDAEGALAAARAGLDELGEDYASADAIDDTGMKLLMAEDMAEGDDLAAGARATLRVLESRAQMYGETHGQAGNTAT